MRLNKYVFLFGFTGNNIIAYNSLNGAVLLLDKADIKNDFQNIPQEQQALMDELGFFLSNEECERQIRDEYLLTKNEELDVIIEFTQECNLRCPYCYQSTWGRKNRISKESLDDLFNYIQTIFDKVGYTSLRLSLFGGEPLLSKENIFYIYDKICAFCKEHNIKLKTFLTTNGILLTEEFIRHFDNLIISITLTNKQDHDIKRRVVNKSSYDIVYGNLKNIMHVFDFEKYKLSIRFNTDYSNIDKFETLVRAVSRLSTNILIDVAYLEEFESSAGYRNYLSLQEFRKWNSTKAIDILIKYGFIVDAAPKIIRRPCHGYSGYNIKLFANGNIGACDAFDPKNSLLTIKNACDSIESVRQMVSRNRLEEHMKQCFSCKEFCLCGGMLFCKKKNCDYGLINLSDFLQTYVKYAQKGQQNMFAFSATTKGV